MLNNNDNQANQAYLFIFFILKFGTHSVGLENSGPLLKSMHTSHTFISCTADWSSMKIIYRETMLKDRKSMYQSRLDVVRPVGTVSIRVRIIKILKKGLFHSTLSHWNLLLIEQTNKDQFSVSSIKYGWILYMLQIDVNTSYQTINHNIKNLKLIHT